MKYIELLESSLIWRGSAVAGVLQNAKHSGTFTHVLHAHSEVLVVWYTCGVNCMLVVTNVILL